MLPSLARKRDVSLCQGTQSGTAAHPAPVQWILEDLFPRANNPGWETDQSLPPSAKLKNEWSYIFTPSYAHTACTRTTYLHLFHTARNQSGINL